MRRSSVTALIALLILAVFRPSPALALGSDLNTPYLIYDRARAVWNAQQYPRYVDSTVVIAVERNGTPEANAYASEQDQDNGNVHVSKFSAEQLANPSTPHGFNIYLTSPGGSMRLKIKPDPVDDPLGVPLLTPTYAFGMRSALLESSDSSSVSLPIIANVSTSHSDYTISLKDNELYDGRDAYHLLLHPARDPNTYRIRELWIDAQSYVTLKAIIAGNLTHPPATQVPWTVTFQTVDGLQYIAMEMANAPLVYSKRETYTQSAILFEDIHTQTAPSTEFLLSQIPVPGALTEPLSTR